MSCSRIKATLHNTAFQSWKLHSHAIFLRRFGPMLVKYGSMTVFQAFGRNPRSNDTYKLIVMFTRLSFFRGLSKSWMKCRVESTLAHFYYLRHKTILLSTVQQPLPPFTFTSLPPSLPISHVPVVRTDSFTFLLLLTANFVRCRRSDSDRNLAHGTVLESHLTHILSNG